MKSRAQIFVSLGTMLLMGVAGHAQPQTGGPTGSDSGRKIPTIRVNVREVSLDVVVTDKKGNVVTDLKPDDFKVYEDNVQQLIRSFVPPKGHEPPADAPVVTSSANVTKIGDAPVTILVLDELDTRFEDMAFAREAMNKYLNRQPAQMLQPTILMVVNEKKFDVIHDYTQNRDDLVNALKKHFPAYPFRMMRNSPTDASERMASALGALMQIAEASSGIRGRKNVIWVGCGFPSISTDSDAVNSDRADELNQAVKDATQILLETRVTLNVIDPSLMATSMIDTSDPDIISPDDLNSATDETGTQAIFANNDINFVQFAPATGGFAYSMRNDVDREIAGAVEKGSNYFTLTYSPTNRSDDPAALRKIRILIDRPGLSANTRTGYYVEPKRVSDEKPPPPSNNRLAFDLTNAALDKIVYNGIEIKPVAVKGGYELQIPANALGYLIEPNDVKHAEVTVMAVCFGTRDHVLSHVTQELATRLPEGLAQNVTFKLPFTIPSGTKLIRFVVRDAINGKMGTADVTPL
jgi:VWFA-related protein